MTHELERLRAAHEEIPDPDPAALAAIRADLLQRHRKTGTVPILRLAPALAAVVIVAAVVAGRPGPAVDAVAQARQALAPDDAIVNYTVRLRMAGAPAAGECRVGPLEVWRASDPTRWRAVQPLPPASRCPVLDLYDGEQAVGPRMEVSYADGRTSTYVPATDVMQVIIEPPEGDGELRAPSSATGAASLQLSGSIVHARKNRRPVDEVRPPDPVSDVEALMRRGDLRDAGEQTRGGRRVHVFTGEWRRAGRLEATVEYVVDAETFVPIEASSANGTAKVTATFGGYERIALTDESAKLLEIRPEREPEVTEFTIEQIKGAG